MKILVTTLWLLVLVNLAEATDPVIFLAGNQEYCGNQVTINYEVQNFTEVNDFQFTVAWDPTKLSFSSISSSLPNNMPLENVDNDLGVCVIQWTADFRTSLQDGSLPLSLTFNVEDNTEIIDVFFTDKTNAEVSQFYPRMTAVPLMYDGYVYHCAIPKLAHDSLELVKIYNDCGGANWTNPWNLNQPVSMWAGVELSNERVTRLLLINRNLNGALPDLVLPHLTLFACNDNQLTGEIPNFTNTLNLTSFHCSGNQLSGAIPNFSNAPDLIYFKCNDNQLTGSIPNFSNIPKLLHFHCYNNQLTGTIPNFSNMPNLYQFYCSNNQLSGSIPDFSHMPDLAFFYCYKNQLEGAIPNFKNTPNLTYFNCADNQLSGKIPNFSKIPNLYSLRCNDNQLSGKIPNFSNTPNLYQFYCWRNQLSGPIPDFSETPYLKYVGFSDNKITSIPDLTALVGLGQIQVHYNQLNFDDLEQIPNQALTVFDYSPQDSIALLWTSLTSLSILAGGSTADNTYYWYKNNILQDVITGDSTFETTGTGKYRCEVKNSNFPILTLYSKELNLCDSINATDALHGPSPFPPLCFGDDQLFSVYSPPNIKNYLRYEFSWNGKVMQDGASNYIGMDYVRDGDIISCMVYDADGCNFLTNYLTVITEEVTEVATCSPSTDSLQITLVQGNPPWSFDLVSLDGEEILDDIPLTVYGIDTILAKTTNIRYEIHNASLENNCTNQEITQESHISGCSAICVGYSTPQYEDYVANFYNYADPESIQWAIFPSVALSSGDVVIITDTASILTLDFPEATANGYITIQATATTQCGTEVLQYQVKLDQNCVWPGDVNDDGQVLTGTANHWVDDALSMGNAYSTQQSKGNNPTNNNSVVGYKRPTGCLAINSYDWVPQSARDWILIDENTGDSIGPATFTVDQTIFNAKYADPNGDGVIDKGQSWEESMTKSFYEIAAPSDYDIVTFHAENQNRHNGNAPVAKMNQFDSLLHISVPDTVVTYGGDVVFIVTLGDSMNIVDDVAQLAFLGEGEFGVFKQPAVKLENSHLSTNYNNLVDYPFVKEDAAGNPNDSLRWYISLANINADTLVGVSFAGEEVCNILCHIIVAGLLDGDSSPSTKQLNEDSLGVPVKFRISAAGAASPDGTITHMVSNEITLYVQPNAMLRANILLEGVYDNSLGLMTDILREKELLPASEPYVNLPGYYLPLEDSTAVRLADSSAVLSVTGQEAIVDWVFIEIRDTTNIDSIIAKRPALVTRQGDLVDLDGVSPVELWGVPFGEYYVMIRHRNHLPVITSQPIALNRDSVQLDFSLMISNPNLKELAPNKMGLFSGNIDGDYGIIGPDKIIFSEQNGKYNSYNNADLDMNGDVNGIDNILWSNNNGRYLVFPK